MRHRVVILAALPWLAVAMMSMVAACAGQASKPGAAAQTAAPKSWVTPRTPEGHPDLQGVWDFRTATPLERRNYGLANMLTAARSEEGSK